jgi:hypothetical protein
MLTGPTYTHASLGDRLIKPPHPEVRPQQRPNYLSTSHSLSRFFSQLKHNPIQHQFTNQVINVLRDLRDESSQCLFMFKSATLSLLSPHGAY